MYSLREGHLEKKFAKHAYQEGHRVAWDDTRVLELVTSGIRNKGISPNGMLNDSNQPTHF
jgi:hypothetical protein